MAHDTITSTDGTSIAYETFGEGEPLIAVAGATCDRALMRPTAQALGRHFTAVNYDRRGRGDSGDTPPYAIEREIEDLAALIEHVGGSAHLYGHSSGAALVLHAVAAGLPMGRFVLHDPPYSPDDASSQAEASSYAQEIRRLLTDDRRDEALETFYRLTGMPDEAIEGMRQTPMWPALIALAPTLAYDSAVMGDLEHGGVIPRDVAARANPPGLVLVGGQSPPFMLDIGARLAELLPDGRHRVIEGQDHLVDPDVLAPIVAEFLRQ